MDWLYLLAEGFDSAFLPCTLILLIPGIGVAMAARETAIPALASYWLSVVAWSWARFAEHAGGWHVAITAVALALAAIVLLFPPVVQLDWVAVAGGLLAGYATAELWLPCVGPELGDLLVKLPTVGPSGVVSMAIFLLGALSPLLALAAAHHLIPDWLLEMVEPPLSVLGGIVLGVMAVAAAIGFHDTLVGWLFQWSIR
jgi:cytochrome c biogenesis protein CcdA